MRQSALHYEAMTTSLVSVPLLALLVPSVLLRSCPAPFTLDDFRANLLVDHRVWFGPQQQDKRGYAKPQNRAKPVIMKRLANMVIPIAIR